jgi:hypothetical protein
MPTATDYTHEYSRLAEKKANQGSECSYHSVATFSFTRNRSSYSRHSIDTVSTRAAGRREEGGEVQLFPRPLNVSHD